MKATELRIGNFVSVLENIVEVFSIEKDIEGGWDNQIGVIPRVDDCEYLMLSKDIKPIPLTEEWLLKFGFEYSTMGIFKIDNFVIVKWKGEDAEFRQFTANRGEPRHTTYLKYVHSLQNLYFAITGQELTIKQTNT